MVFHNLCYVFKPTPKLKTFRIFHIKYRMKMMLMGWGFGFIPASLQTVCVIGKLTDEFMTEG